MDKTQGAAIILAAGSSTRMGRCKALLPWQGETLLSYQIRQWVEVGMSPLIVLSPHNAISAAPHCLEQPAVINPRPEQGKSSSIRVGLDHLQDPWDWLGISAVDQPRPDWIYRRLINSFDRNRPLITAPAFEGRIGHPVLLRSDLKSELLAIREETFGLRQIMRQHSGKIYRVAIEDPVVMMDLNTPERYQAESERWSAVDKDLLRD